MTNAAGAISAERFSQPPSRRYRALRRAYSATSAQSHIGGATALLFNRGSEKATDRAARAESVPNSHYWAAVV